MSQSNKQSKEINITQKLLLVTLAAMVLMVAWQLIILRFFLNRVSSIYEGNMDYVMDELVRNLTDAFSFQGMMVEGFSNNQDIKEYAASRDTSARYTMAYGTVRPIIITAAANSRVDAVIIYDNTRAWYQYLGTMSTSGLKILRAAYWNQGSALNEIITLDGASFLCSSAPIISFKNERQFIKSGFVVALTNLQHFRPKLGELELLKTGTILIHNDQSILLSSDKRLEGQPLGELDQDEAQYYRMEQVVLHDLLKVTVLMPRDGVFPTRSAYWLIFLSAGVFLLLLMLALSLMVNRWLVKPYRIIMNGIHELPQKGLSGRLENTGVRHMDLMTNCINDTLYRLEEATDQAMKAQQRTFDIQMERHRLEMALLRKQIDTHFFYNSLISIKYLSERGEAKKAGDMAQGVATLLRYVHTSAALVPILDEMSILQRYIQMMNIRFNDRFTVDFDVDDLLSNYQMPPMLLQPLVENSFLHGLDAKAPPCLLSICGKIEDTFVIFSLTDNGLGMNEESLQAIRFSMSQEMSEETYSRIKGISLVNIHKRIQALFGIDYGLDITSSIGQYTKVVIKLPLLDFKDEGELPCPPLH